MTAAIDSLVHPAAAKGQVSSALTLRPLTRRRCLHCRDEGQPGKQCLELRVIERHVKVD
jgi:hypothetical protein